ncbi:hypothetical protein I3760_11G193000 [Carya illinoinensis]|uniref:glycerophosphodiester phosphodiesterase n=1 Tax=Carya illinoinensis TaxID=32201 RepID=A0A922DSC9_CARIL|nr:hypothetical protein I3760_11G193000 [Carya illinoinensis]KAG6689878.1 hypothetical protein I3842_11G195800 [Carya illinoinensis]
MICRRVFPAMSSSRGRTLFILLLHSVVAALVSAQGSNKTSNPPLVIARGGFSGLFPDSSSTAYDLALQISVPDVFLWCDVQLTKDGAGICVPDMRLENATDISFGVYKSRSKLYLVNGAPTKGWFSVDFTFSELVTNVILTQGVYSRSNKFDGSGYQILTVQNLTAAMKPPGLWLNIQHDAFFRQHNLSMRSFVLSASRSVIIGYISSPEVDFLRSITKRFNPSTTKLVFRFLGSDEIEPSTNQTYGALLKNLTSIKTFASGILIPKAYIWPVDPSLYLQPYTTVVVDAHKAGLEVFASDFANDVPFSFNYSYDPITEQLSFIDNDDFSVDGLLTDFPMTSSAAIDCFAHLGKNATAQAKPLIISKNGASGDYPGCTDLAYAKAIEDKVDVLDCPVQLAKDGTPFCLSTINLIDSTTVAQTVYSNLTTSIPEIKAGSGIFAFNLTWTQIQGLTPAIANPYSNFRLFRNPKYKNTGKFLTLSDFLKLAKNASSLTGVLISIEHAAYLADQGLSVTDAVINALSKAGYGNQASPKVMIQSTNSSVLMKFKDKKNYECVYKVDENIRDALDSTVMDIKTFAHSVVVGKDSVYPENQAFISSTTDTVSKLQSFKLPVYVELFSNEFVSQAYDFYSDATVEINTYVMAAKVDGVITDFPKTAARYKRNRCLGFGDKAPSYMSPIPPAALMQVITPSYMPPAEAPNPVLTIEDVREPPLPSVSARGPSTSPSGGTSAVAPTPPNGQPKLASCFFLTYLAMLLAALFLS